MLQGDRQYLRPHDLLAVPQYFEVQQAGDLLPRPHAGDSLVPGRGLRVDAGRQRNGLAPGLTADLGRHDHLSHGSLRAKAGCHQQGLAQVQVGQSLGPCLHGPGDCPGGIVPTCRLLTGPRPVTRWVATRFLAGPYYIQIHRGGLRQLAE